MFDSISVNVWSSVYFSLFNTLPLCKAKWKQLSIKEMICARWKRNTRTQTTQRHTCCVEMYHNYCCHCGIYVMPIKQNCKGTAYFCRWRNFYFTESLKPLKYFYWIWRKGWWSNESICLKVCGPLETIYHADTVDKYRPRAASSPLLSLHAGSSREWVHVSGCGVCRVAKWVEQVFDWQFNYVLSACFPVTGKSGLINRFVYLGCKTCKLMGFVP